MDARIDWTEELAGQLEWYWTTRLVPPGYVTER